MFYTYVLQSKSDKNFYIGFTNDLKKRFSLHNQGKVESTKNRLPFVLVYYEACLNQKDALKREKYFKTGFGRRFLNNRLESHFSGSRWRAGEKQKVIVKKSGRKLIIEDWKPASR
jgi:putative endonuclease